MVFAPLPLVLLLSRPCRFIKPGELQEGERRIADISTQQSPPFLQVPALSRGLPGTETCNF